MSVLLPYQRRWLDDRSRFKVGMFSRQTGKTFTSTLEVCLDCLENPKKTWVILSRGERQAREALEMGVKRHLEAMSLVFESHEESFDATTKVLEARLPNGSRIMALPANPATARGFSGSVLLDEFAWHQDSEKIWQALFPVISAGHQLRVLSTPNGKGNRFYKLISGDDSAWSRHIVDIYQAVEQGLPRNISELRDALNDPVTWAQEFELQFLDEETAWLPYELIDSVESDRMPILRGSGCYLGWDVARRRDLSVLWVINQAGETVEIVSMRGETFEQQIAKFRRLMSEYSVARACIDASGMGEMITEQLQSEFSRYKVEGVQFTNSNKHTLASLVRQRFENRQALIPKDRTIRESLHSIRRIALNGGVIRFDADRSEAGGHADHFWALALAFQALGSAVASDCETAKTGRLSDMLDSSFYRGRPWLSA